MKMSTNSKQFIGGEARVANKLAAKCFNLTRSREGKNVTLSFTSASIQDGVTMTGFLPGPETTERWTNYGK